MAFSVDSSDYIHKYKAYRIPKGTTVKNAAGEDVILSEEKDTLVLTASSARQLVNDRRDFGNALKNETEQACQKTQEEAQKKQFEDQAKALAVYRSMVKGAIVPSTDERKLMEYDDKLYQAAKMAQALKQLEEDRIEKKKSKWNAKEEQEYEEKMARLNADAKEKIEGMNTEFGKFSGAQLDSIVEVDSSHVDFSSFKTIGLGGVIGEFIDLSI